MTDFPFKKGDIVETGEDRVGEVVAVDKYMFEVQIQWYDDSLNFNYDPMWYPIAGVKHAEFAELTIPDSFGPND